MRKALAAVDRFAERWAAAWDHVKDEDTEYVRGLLGFIVRNKKNVRHDVAELERYAGAEGAAAFESLMDDVAAGPEGIRAALDRERPPAAEGSG